MSAQTSPEPESQVSEEPRVTVYKPTTGCIGCTNTLRLMVREGIKYQLIEVSPEHVALTDELKLAAEELGVKPEYPCVHVFYPATGDERVWFGFIPDNIKNITKGNAA